MEDLEPIRQLKQLLDDPGKLLEKISSIQSALGSICAPDAIGGEEPSARNPPADEVRLTPESRNQQYARAQQALDNMKAQIEERLLPLARAMSQAQIEQLRGQARLSQTTMNECLAQVDRRMLACLDRIHELMRKYTDLDVFNQKLAMLGSPTEPLPDFVPSEDPTKIIQGRLDVLRRNGKI